MNELSRQHKNRSQSLKLTIVWLTVFLLGLLWISTRAASDPVSVAVIPEVPREGEPVLAVFKLNNASPSALSTRYQFYVNGVLLKEGSTTLSPDSSKTYQQVYRSQVKLGEQATFAARVSSSEGTYEKVISVPPYPPQLWSSFVSFASFSTSVMSSMSSAIYYSSIFGPEKELNAGIILFLTLIMLLIFLELTQELPVRLFHQPMSARTANSSISSATGAGKRLPLLGGLRRRFSTVTWILLIIFVCTVYTKVVLILSI
jgi:hypothetical protein